MADKLDVKKLLENHYTKEDDYTHLSMGRNPGRFRFDDIDGFYNKYNKYLWHEDLALVERPTEYAPLTMDIDLVYPGNKSARQYNKKDIVNVIQNMNTVLESVCDEVNTDAYVMEKDKPTIRTTDVKDGFHIIYPYTAFTKREKEALYNAFMNQIGKDGTIFEHMDLVNTVNEVFDKQAMVTNNWMLYGSRKKNGQPYKCTFHYKNDKGFKINKTDEELVKLFSVRKFTKDDRSITDDSKISEYYGLKRKSSLDNLLIDNDIHDMDSVKKLTEEEQEKIIKEARKLLNLLSEKSATSYDDWLHVGWILGGISPKLYPAYLEFSKRTTAGNYDEQACKKVFYSARRTGQRFTIRTLHFMANRDDPKNYRSLVENEFIREKVNELNKDVNIAETIASLCRNRFVFSTKKPGCWYSFDNKWNKCDIEADLYKFITRDFQDLLLKLSMELTGKMLKMDHDNVQRKIMEENKKSLDGAVLKLKSHSFVTSVIKSAANFMADNEFEDKLNHELYLVGFNNGVYDLENRIFRPTLPEDYISITTKYDYRDYLANSENREQDLKEIKIYMLSGKEPTNMENFPPKLKTSLKILYKYFSQVQPEAESRNYLFLMLASALDGKANQLFPIWTGCGANGKSTTIELMKHVFGEYAGTLDPTAITRKAGNSAGARPELANKEGKRFVEMQEPDDDDSIKTGLMKQLVSGDEQEVRKLFGDPKSVVFQFKLFFSCNTLPDISARDDGTWRRIRVLNWGMKFVRHPKADNEFKIDYDMGKKLRNSAQAFMFILTEIFYPEYRKNGIEEPDSVTKFTEQYKEETNVYYGFIRDMLEQTGKQDDLLALSDLTKQFRGWYRDNYNGKCPSQKEIKRYLMDNKYTVKNNALVGFTFKTLSEDNLDFDIKNSGNNALDAK